MRSALIAFLSLIGLAASPASAGAVCSSTNIAGCPQLNGITLGGQNSQGSLVVAPLTPGTIPPVPSGALPAAQTTNQAVVNWTGGTSGVVVDLAGAYINITGAPNDYIWTQLVKLDFNGTGGTGQHVAQYNQAHRYTYASGGATNNPQQWAAVAEFADYTGQNSAVTNAELAEEFDFVAAGLDNGGPYTSRTNLAIVNRVPAAYNATTFPFGCKGISSYPCFGVSNGGISQFAQNGMYLNQAFSFGGPFLNAVVDIRYAGSASKLPTTASNNLGGTIASTTTASVTSSTTIPVSNVLPFTRDQFGRDINYQNSQYANSSSASISFSDGQTATVVAYSVTGYSSTPAGTITLSAPQTHASGVTVYSQTFGIWLGSGQGIALDDYGATNINSDGTNIYVTGPVVMNNSLKIGLQGLTIGTNPNAAIGVDANNLVLVHNLPIRDPGYALSALPAVTASNEGTIAFCNNCTNLGQKTGSATGSLVIMSTDGSYRNVFGQLPSTTQTLLALTPYTVATLPTCNSGLQNQMASVTDATSPTYNGTLTGGGSVNVPVFCNGSAWTSH